MLHRGRFLSSRRLLVTSLGLLHAVDLEAVDDISIVDLPVNSDAGAGGCVLLLGLK